MARYGYARISTDRQEFASQLAALKAANCGEIVRETASGAKEKRPLLTALIADLRPGDALVVYRLDRLARSVSQLIALTQEIERAGATLVSLSDQIDTSTANGKLFFHIFAALAEFERNLIVERTRSGLAAARAAGRTGGRPKALTASQIARAQQWLADGTMTQSEAAKALGVARSTLVRSLPPRSARVQ